MTTPLLTITPSFQPRSICQLSYTTPPLCGPHKHEWGMQLQSVHCRNARLVSCPLPLIWCCFTDLQMCEGPVQHMNTSPPTHAHQNNHPLTEHHRLKAWHQCLNPNAPMPESVNVPCFNAKEPQAPTPQWPTRMPKPWTPECQCPCPNTAWTPIRMPKCCKPPRWAPLACSIYLI